MQYRHFVDDAAYVQHVGALLVFVELAPAHHALVRLRVLARARQTVLGGPGTQHTLNETEQLLNVRL